MYVSNMTLVRFTESRANILNSAVLVLDGDQPWTPTALTLVFKADATLQPKSPSVFWLATSLNNALMLCTILHGMKRDLLAAILPLTDTDSRNVRTDTIVAGICVGGKDGRRFSV